MKENLEDILREKMSGYEGAAPDLKQSIFSKMDARMSGEQFEEAVREKVTNYAPKSPNILAEIFATRTAWLVLRNRLILGVERYRYAVFAVVVLGLLWSTYRSNDVEPAEQTAIAVQQQQDKAIADQPVNNDQVDIAESQRTPVTEPVDPGNTVVHDTRSNNSTGARPHRQETHHAVNGPAGIEGNRAQETDQKRENSMTSATPKEIASANPPAVETEEPPVSLVITEGEEPVEQVVDGEDPVATTTSGNQDEQPVTVSEPAEKDDPESVSPNVKADNREELDKEESTPFKEIKPVPIKKFSLDAYYAPAYASRVLYGEDQNLIDLRNGSETVRYSFGTGMRINWELAPKLEFQLGLEYNVRNEYVSHTTSTEVEEMDVTSRTVIYRDPVLPDREVTIYDTSYSSYTIQSHQNSANRYRSITVPLLLRYTIYYDQWGFYVNSGLRMRVWSEQEGYVLNTNGELQDVNRGVYSKQMFSPSFQLGMGAMYRFTDRLSVFGEPSRVYGLRPVSSGSYVLEQKDRTLSLLLGARLNF